MNRPLISNSVFSAASWLLLFAAMASVAATGLEVYQRHIRPASAQQFNFGSTPVAESGRAVGLASTISAHLFGTVPVKKEPKAEKPKVVEAPETRLNLSLTGVVTAPDPQNSHAMIEVERGQTSVVRVGAEIGKTGARLNAVFPDHILIDHRGKLEKLAIDRQSLDLTNVSGSNAQTISSLNINVAEFEALAAVDPKDLDISTLLPPPAPVPQQQNGDELTSPEPEDGAAVAAQMKQEALLAADRQKQQLEEQRERDEEARRQLLEQQQLQQDQLQQQLQQDQLQQQLQQQNQVDGQGRPVKKQVPGGLKQI